MPSTGPELIGFGPSYTRGENMSALSRAEASLFHPTVRLGHVIYAETVVLGRHEPCTKHDLDGVCKRIAYRCRNPLSDGRSALGLFLTAATGVGVNTSDRPTGTAYELTFSDVFGSDNADEGDMSELLTSDGRDAGIENRVKADYGGDKRLPAEDDTKPYDVVLGLRGSRFTMHRPPSDATIDRWMYARELEALGKSRPKPTGETIGDRNAMPCWATGRRGLGLIERGGMGPTDERIDSLMIATCFPGLWIKMHASH